MAKVTTPLLSFAARGRIAKLVNYQKWKGRAYAKRFTKGRDPRTAAQALSRDTFAVGDAIWTGAPALLQAPFNRFATGQVKSGYNVWQGLYTKENLGQANLSAIVFSPGAKGGLPTNSISVVAGDGTLTVTFANPPSPLGWTLQSVIAAAIRDGDPRSTTFTEVTAAEDAVTQTTVVLAGLTNGVDYVVSGWPRWAKPDGTIAYGPSTLTQTLAPATPYTVNAVHFDGVNDWLNRGGALTGAVDNNFLLGSFWLQMSVDGASHAIHAAAIANDLHIIKPGNNKMGLTFGGTAGLVWNVLSTPTIVVADGWVNVLFSLNAGDGSRHLFFNDVQVAYDTDTFNAGRDIDWTQTDNAVGALVSAVIKLNGDLAEFYLTNEYLDLSVTANRREFIDGAGKPVDLGVDGSNPTGTAALMLFSGPTVAWHTNKGSGGGFTENGALTTAATSPSD